MTYQSAQIINLAFAVALIPAIAYGTSRLRYPIGRLWFSIGYLAIVLSFVCDVTETYVMPETLNAIQHGFQAFAAICYLMAGLQLRRAVISRLELP